MVIVRVGKVRKLYPNFQMVPLSMTFSDLWPTFQGKDHRLHSSASTVWTANGERPSQWEMANFDPSQNQNPWADCNKIPHNWLRLRKDTLNQIWYKSIHWGLLGIWVKYNVFVPFLFIYLYLFFWDSHTGQTGWWIFTRDSSSDVKSRKDVPFWGYKT